MYRIFIIEDDRELAHTVAARLERWGYEPKCTENFQNVISEFSKTDPHLVLIDITLPFFDGYHWCSEIRKISDVPIIFLSSAADNMNIVMAVSLGADDFIAKPFDFSVLNAKLQAVLRRTYNLSGKTPLVEHNGAVLDLNTMTVSCGGKKAELTKNEFKILQTLFENKNSVVSRETLMLRLWEIDSYIEENTLTVNINRLRKKLSLIGLDNLIKTKIGRGYIVE